MRRTYRILYSTGNIPDITQVNQEALDDWELIQMGHRVNAQGQTEWAYLMAQEIVEITPDTLVGLFTVTTSDSRVHINEHALNNNDKVRFQLGIEAGNVLPAPLISGTYYFVVGSRINDFQVSLSSGGSALRITDTGVGTTNECWKQ